LSHSIILYRPVRSWTSILVGVRPPRLAIHPSFVLVYMVAKFPLVGVMWRGYAATCIGLRIIADRQE
jgi:hypothetical protein